MDFGLSDNDICQLWLIKAVHIEVQRKIEKMKPDRALFPL